jgi:hypothetical protein
LIPSFPTHLPKDIFARADSIEKRHHKRADKPVIGNSFPPAEPPGQAGAGSGPFISLVQLLCPNLAPDVLTIQAGPDDVSWKCESSSRKKMPSASSFFVPPTG